MFVDERLVLFSTKKKIILVITMLAIVFLMTGCQRTTDINGIERDMVYGLVVVDRHGSGIMIAYDPKTLVCYLVVDRPYRLGISPYYIVSKSCVPEIAIYGVNYK